MHHSIFKLDRLVAIPIANILIVQNMWKRSMNFSSQFLLVFVISLLTLAPSVRATDEVPGAKQ